MKIKKYFFLKMLEKEIFYHIMKTRRNNISRNDVRKIYEGVK